MCLKTQSPSLKFFQHQQIVYWSQYCFQHPVIWYTKTLPGRLWRKEITVEQTGFTLHAHQRARFHVLFGCLGSHAAFFPAKFRTRLSWREWKGGREGQMSIPCSLLLPWEIALLPPISSTQSSNSWSQSTNLHCWAFCFNGIEMLTHK